MRVLLDENIDRLLKPLFDLSWHVVTVGERDWTGKQNGELLQAAEKEFDVFVTMDRNLPHQQNLAALNLSVVVIQSHSNAFGYVSPLMDQVNNAVRNSKPGTAVDVKG